MKFLALFFYLVSCAAMAADHSLIVEGLKRTHPSVIEQERRLYPETSPDEFAGQLMQMGLFSSAQAKNTEQGLLVQLEEKWTTIPIFKFNSGGGSRQTIIGLYDPNVGGRRIELGYQFELLENSPSHVVWFKNPRLNGSLFFSDLQLWDIKRVRVKYNQDLNEPVVNRAFLLSTKRAYLAIGKELSRDLKVRGSLELRDDSASFDLVSEKLLSSASSNLLPEPSAVNLFGLRVDHGEIKTNRSSLVGHLSMLSLSSTLNTPGRSARFQKLQAEHIFHHQLSDSLFYAQRFQIGYVSTNLVQFWNYLGGLESIRGFSDNRFAAQSYWLSNTELRLNLVDIPSYVIQGVNFVDALGINEQSRKVTAVAALSTGVGLRMILPKIYRLVVRLDFAKPLLNSDDQPVSFGIQQFF